MTSPSLPLLFQPKQLGDLTLKHRVVVAPCTRLRANIKGVQPDWAADYYGQRATTPGTLIITEATYIHGKAGGSKHVPSLETEEQLAAWEKVTDAVHSKGSYIFVQIWALGRTASPDVIASEGYSFVAPSSIGLKTRPSPQLPRPLTIPEIKEYVKLFAKAAHDAVNIAGFDGIELHAANGYLVDQFFQPCSNQRTDEYGGSIENRNRFGLEIIDAICKAIGPHKVGIRLSPWSHFQEMGMDDPIPQFSHLVQKIVENHPDMAYIHVVEPRVNGSEDRNLDTVGNHECNDFLRKIWSPRPFISAGGFTKETAIKTCAEKGDLVAFGRPFIANPDLPLRFFTDTPLNPYDRKTFYVYESKTGYNDYPFAEGLDPLTIEKAQSASKL